jgi:eukaryotic-like serine/threonine-protein kinase
MALPRLADRVGQVLSARYRLLAPIGTGASASVYLADDVTLRRRVAVKILHPALADDDAFLRRFRAEAQAAAALNHPNVMAVYDWGQDDVPYLVTEYLGGGSLRTILDQGRLLTPAQTLVIGLEAGRGLDYAHRRGFVHRDIKPANLLFGEDARLRISDFGLARALAEAAWTEPQGAVMGTARYASPEQARGETLDGRSDVYSLGLVMIEAVTGTVPFSTDTTIGTLMARVDRPVDVPESLGPLRAPLLAAGANRAVDRPDAADFTRQLMISAEQLDRPDPLELAGAIVHDHDVVADRDPTIMRRSDAEPDIMSAPPGTVMDGIRIIPDAETDAAAAAAAATATTKTRRRKQAAADPLSQLVPVGEGDPDEPERMRSWRPHLTTSRPWRVIVLSLLLVAAVLAAGAVWWFDVRVPTHAVPNLVGTNVAALEHNIGGNHWQVQRSSVERDGTVVGQILAQHPAPHTRLAENKVLTLLVSLGPPPVPVPQNLVGQPLVAATSELQASQLALGPVTPVYDETHGNGVVLGFTSPQPAQLPKGSAVPLTVSKGPKPRVVPTIAVNTPIAQATATLQAVGLKVATTPQPSDTIPAGNTTGPPTPAPGAQVPRGSTVNLPVSSGPPMVTIPADIVGKSVTAAAAELQALGLSVSGTQGSPLGTVQGSTPAVGTSVHKGTAVLLVTG